MEQQKILDELADIQRRIAEYLEILGSEKVLRDADHQGTEGSPEGLRRRAPHRRSSKTPARSGWKIWSQVEDVAVTVTRGGYLKRTAVDTYRRQTRGGKGRIGMGTRTEDFVEHLIVASTHATC